MKKILFTLFSLFSCLFLLISCTNGEIDNSQQLMAVRVYLLGGETNTKPEGDAKIPYDWYESFELPTEYGDCTIRWESNKEDIISTSGEFNFPEIDTEVQLTAYVNVKNQHDTSKSNFATFTITVLAHYELDNDRLFQQLEQWLNEQLPNETYSNIVLPTEGPSSIKGEATISWESSNIQLMNNKGERLNLDSSSDVTFTGKITLKNKATKNYTKVISILPFNPEDDENFFEFLMLSLDAIVPEFLCGDIELPLYMQLGNDVASINWNISHPSILETTGAFHIPEKRTDISITAIVTLPNKKFKTFLKKVTALPENDYPEEIQEVINEIEYKFRDKSFSSDIPSSYLFTEYNGAKVSWSSLNNNVIDGDGKFNQPTYDKSVTLVARISLGSYVVEYGLNLTAKGLVSIPEPTSIEAYLKKQILNNGVIESDLYLPGKYNEADARGITSNVLSEDVKLTWKVSMGDESVLINGNQIQRKKEDVKNVTLTATLTFDNEYLGEINLYNVTIQGVSDVEMYRYANKYIINHLTLNLSNDFELPISTDKYDIQVSWTTSNPAMANVENGVVKVSPGADNMSNIILYASLMQDGLQFGEDLSYNVNLVTNSKVIAKLNEYSENIPDETLRRYMVSRFGTFNVLTVDSFKSTNMKDDKWYTLDLSYNPNAQIDGKGINKKLTSLKGIGYLTTLRKLNITGQDLLPNLAEVAPLKNLEVFIARNCGVGLNDGGVNPFNQLTNLSILDLSNNNITTTNILGNHYYNKLQYLYLDNNSIFSVENLRFAENIEYLALSNNNISDITELANLKKLKYLSLDNNKINDISSLSVSLTLEVINLSCQNADFRDASALESLINLRKLNISNNAIDSLEFIRDMKKLEVLDASSNNISAGAYVLNGIVSLRKLILNDNNITGNTKFITNLVNLKVLQLSNNNFSNTNFSLDVQGLKSLEVLGISSYHSSFIIEKLDFLSEMPNLIHLEIPDSQIPQTYTVNSVSNQTEVDNVEMLSKCENLMYLNISGNAFTNLSKLSKLGNSLKELVIDNLNLTEEGQKGEDGNHILRSFHLDVLSASNCNLSKLREDGVSYFVDYSNGLWYLNLSNNKFSEEIDINDFSNTSRYKNLKYLIINNDKNAPKVVNAHNLKKFENLEALGLKNSDVIVNGELLLPKGLTYINLAGVKNIYNRETLNYLYNNFIDAQVYLDSNSNLPGFNPDAEIKSIASCLNLSPIGLKNEFKENIDQSNYSFDLSQFISEACGYEPLSIELENSLFEIITENGKQIIYITQENRDKFLSENQGDVTIPMIVSFDIYDQDDILSSSVQTILTINADALVGYTVHHYYMNTNGEYIKGDNSYAYYDKYTSKKNEYATVTGTLRPRVGFSNPEEKSIVLQEDEDLNVIEYYYPRNKYAMTFKQNNGQDDRVEYFYYQEGIIYPEITANGYHFLGWLGAIETMPANNVSCEALWERTSTDIVHRDGTNIRVTDKDKVYQEVNPNLNIELLKSLGYTKLTISITFDCQEVNDGYQDLWIYTPGDRQLNSATVEHGKGYKDTSWWAHTVSFTINISDVSSTGLFKIRWGAHGGMGDDWNLGRTTYTITALQ